MNLNVRGITLLKNSFKRKISLCGVIRRSQYLHMVLSDNLVIDAWVLRQILLQLTRYLLQPIPFAHVRKPSVNIDFYMKCSFLFHFLELQFSTNENCCVSFSLQIYFIVSSRHVDVFCFQKLPLTSWCWNCAISGLLF